VDELERSAAELQLGRPDSIKVMSNNSLNHIRAPYDPSINQLRPSSYDARCPKCVLFLLTLTTLICTILSLLQSLLQLCFKIQFNLLITHTARIVGRTGQLEMIHVLV
jgi:hypothetical protein